MKNTLNDSKWNEYVRSHPRSTAYHLAEWLRAIWESYGHSPIFLVAFDGSHKEDNDPRSHRCLDDKSPSFIQVEDVSEQDLVSEKGILGVLPLVGIRHFFLGRSLTSIPFFDASGVLANDAVVEKALLSKAATIAEKGKFDTLELRQAEPLEWLGTEKARPFKSGNSVLATSINKGKVRMVLELPDSSEKLLKTFKAKLRSQIRKPIKEGLTYKVGGPELLNHFYEVFLVNMRDLGSPVHSKCLIDNVLRHFPAEGRIVLAQHRGRSLAAGVLVGFKDTMWNPWASSLRQYSAVSPNMLLYWAMLEYACDNGFRYFDFGRSTPGEGTFRFKEQWGAKARPLYWYSVCLKGKDTDFPALQRRGAGSAVEIWRKLPLSVTRLAGPRIRKYINL